MKLHRMALVAGALACAASPTMAQDSTGARDPRVGLHAGYQDAGEAARNLKLAAHVAKPAGFFDANDPGAFHYANSDMAFDGNYVLQGNFNGFQVWDISNPSNPVIHSTFVCPGGQGDLSVFRNLLFMSVEETRARIDCGTQGIADSVSAERFRGVRIFDISDIDHPRQIAAVQTCRGSHTHTLAFDRRDTTNLYVYVSGTSVVRSPNELAGCSGKRPDEDPNTSLFRIDVIRVPLAAPQDAKVIASPRVFADSAGHIAGLWKGGTHGEGTQETYETNMCHDITVYSAIGLAAGACSGNGILLDVRDPAHPRRVDAVMDPNFAYWHSATFNNDGTKVIYTDEWGGGVAPRCRATDRPQWGADAIFTLDKRKLHEASFFKMPAVQTDQENCVAHNGSLIPVPGRDIMVQAWYQGGLDVFDFTDAEHPKEIAFFDRGPIDSTKLYLGGYWSAYWYNGNIYGSEIARGLDVFQLEPSADLSQNEIDAAKLARVDMENVQNQQRIVWPASVVVSRAYLDQLRRSKGLSEERLESVSRELDKAEGLKGQAQRGALVRLASELDRDAAKSSDAKRVRELAASVRRLVDASK